MTIRYKCRECESVLKIRDELAGTDAKCPKCKTAFVIPQPELVGAAAGKESTLSVGAAGDDEEPLDMPREITPMPDLSSLDESGETGSHPALPSVAEANAPKPSIAELMREHEAKQKKKKDASDKRRGGLAEAAVAAEVMTSGTAADAITRSYDQKRGKAGEPPPMTREERREAEQKEAMIAFAKKAIPAVGGVAVMLYFTISWMLGDSLPDLEYVSGVITLQGAPLGDAEVMFSPTRTPGGEALDNARPSTAMTNASGEFILMYDMAKGYEGAIPGTHRVSIMSSSGAMFNLPTQDQEKVVSSGGDNTFNFEL